MKKKLNFSKVLFWIVTSVFIFSLFNVFLYSQIKKWKRNRLVLKKYDIEVVSHNVQQNMLDTNYLSELLDLSWDNQTNIFAFDDKKALETLKASPLIKEVSIKKLKPNNIFVEYSLRKPIAILYDFENTAIDSEGFIFPLKPFYKDKNLPTIYLNLEKFDGFKKIENRKTALALSLINKLKSSGFSDLVKINTIDTSRIHFKSYGKREIILSLQEEIRFFKNQKEHIITFPVLLRLGMNNFSTQISNYLSLRKQMLNDYEKQLVKIDDLPDTLNFSSKTIDLRISKLAFIDQ